jgi:hypothetical protein
MNIDHDIAPIYPCHDLFVEIGKVELAMDYLARHDDARQAQLRARLASRMDDLRAEWRQLAG